MNIWKDLYFFNFEVKKNPHLFELLLKKKKLMR